MKKQKLIFLGTGAGDCSSDRAKTSLLLLTKNTGSDEDVEGVLIDAGDGCVGNLSKLKICLLSLRAIVISHGHSDHICSLPLIIQCIALSGNKRLVELHCPQYLKEPITNWLKTLSLNPDNLPFELKIKEIIQDKSIEVGGFKILPHETKHDSSNGRQSFGFRIHSEKEKIFYSSDVVGPEDLRLIETNMPGIVIVELAHLAPSDISETLKNAVLKKLFITHIGKEYYENRAEILSDLQIALAKAKEIIEATDLMEVEL
ncbi:MAG: MBL fold metallo-hydrolase [Chthoniobacterales bacterium]|nr:MBL fold metallo-hydrolase [Chthoniobacterales bacterium]